MPVCCIKFKLTPLFWHRVELAPLNLTILLFLVSQRVMLLLVMNARCVESYWRFRHGIIKAPHTIIKTIPAISDAGLVPQWLGTVKSLQICYSWNQAREWFVGYTFRFDATEGAGWLVSFKGHHCIHWPRSSPPFLKHSFLATKAILNLQCWLKSCTCIVSNLKRNLVNVRVCLFHEDIRLYCLAKAAGSVRRFVQRVELPAHPLLPSVADFAVVALNKVLDRILLLVNRPSTFCMLGSL